MVFYSIVFFTILRIENKNWGNCLHLRRQYQWRFTPWCITEYVDIPYCIRFAKPNILTYYFWFQKPLWNSPYCLRLAGGENIHQNWPKEYDYLMSLNICTRECSCSDSWKREIIKQILEQVKPDTTIISRGVIKRLWNNHNCNTWCDDVCSVSEPFLAVVLGGSRIFRRKKKKSNRTEPNLT